MSNPFPQEAQQRLRTLYRYAQALEHGDLERVASLLRLAEQDEILDCLFQEIDLLYQTQDRMTVQPDELAALQERLAYLHQQGSETTQAQPSTTRTWASHRHAVFPFQQERRQTPMNHPSTPFTPEEQEERGMFQAQPLPRRRRVARFSQMLAAVLVAVVLVGGLIGTLQLTRLHHVPSTSVAHSGSTPVFQGGDYLIQAKENGDGNPNANATTMIPNVSLSPSWSYSLTMTRAQGDIVPSYGDAFGLIFAYTKERAYALTFDDVLGTPSIGLSEYNWSMNHQGQEPNGDPVPFTPLPIGSMGGYTARLNPSAFHTGLNAVNTVKVTATAHSLTIFVNGQSAGTIQKVPVITGPSSHAIQDITVGSGQFGMFVDTTGTEVKFQNVLITQP